jgi:hypothetical protein
VFRTTDSGRTWQLASQRIGGADTLRGFSAIARSMAWAVSKDYAKNSDVYYVWRTTDGVHWSKAPLAS